MEVILYLFPVVLVPIIWLAYAKLPVNPSTVPSSSITSDPKKRTAMAVMTAMGYNGVIFFTLGQIYLRHWLHYRDPNVTATLVAGYLLRRRVMDKCPVFIYSRLKDLKCGKNDECVVCLNHFQDNGTLKMLPKCKHVFHQRCIDAWLPFRLSCPICCQSLTPETEEREQLRGAEVVVAEAEQPQTETVAAVVGPKDVMVHGVPGGGSSP